MYQIVEINRQDSEAAEQLGTKEKFWFTKPGDTRKWLFKFSRDNTGEDWAENVAAELAKILLIDHADVELAICEGRHGTITRSFVDRARADLIHGNELLAGLLQNYDKTKKRRQSDHSITNIENVFAHYFPADTKPFRDFCKYLVLDALIGNTDRHHENWGFLSVNEGNATRYLLAPTFDHASSLGRELSDSSKAQKLSENAIVAYRKKGTGGIYLRDTAAPSPFDLLMEYSTSNPECFIEVIGRLRAMHKDDLREILVGIPGNRITPISHDFALNFLYANFDAVIKMGI